MTTLFCCHCDPRTAALRAFRGEAIWGRRALFWRRAMAEPGPRNLITDVPGVLVGQAQDEAGCTGTTVVLCEAPAIAAVDVRGGAPGSRETELLDPAALVQRVDAIVLSGGSAFRLDTAGRVMDGLAAAA